MTNRPFHSPQPSDDDVNNLNSLLDAMASGTRAPKADPASDTDAIAATARLVSGQPAADETPSEQTLDKIWRNVMDAQSTAALSLPGPVTGASAGGASGTWRVPPQAPASRLNSFLSFAAVAAVIIGLIGGAWMLRENGTPAEPERSRLAAPLLEESTPEASAESDQFWLDYIVSGPQSCTSTGLTWEEQNELLSEERDWPERSYMPIQDPSDEDARGAAMSAREWEECGTQAPVTERFVWEEYSPKAPPFNERSAQNRAIGKEISEQFPIQDPTNFLFVTDQEPYFGIGRSQSDNYIMTVTYVPDHAVQLADGRIAIPYSQLFWEDDPNIPLNPDGTLTMGDYYWGRMVILANEVGEWKADERVDFCIGECNDFWAGTILQPVVPGGTPTPTSFDKSTAATPSTNVDPVINVDFTSYVQPNDCQLKPMSANRFGTLLGEEHDWPARTYGPASQPSVNDAAAAAADARGYLACETFDDSGLYASERYIWMSMSQHSPTYAYYNRIAHVEGNGREVSRELGNLMPDDLVVETSDQPDVIQAEHSYTYVPDQALQFPDGRIGFPIAYLVPDDTALDMPETVYSTMVVFSNESGAWMADDALSICIGECDEYINGGRWEETVIDLPGATPGATPED